MKTFLRLSCIFVCSCLLILFTKASYAQILKPSKVPIIKMLMQDIATGLSIGPSSKLSGIPANTQIIGDAIFSGFFPSLTSPMKMSGLKRKIAQREVLLSETYSSTEETIARLDIALTADWEVTPDYQNLERSIAQKIATVLLKLRENDESEYSLAAYQIMLEMASIISMRNAQSLSLGMNESASNFTQMLALDVAILFIQSISNPLNPAYSDEAAGIISYLNLEINSAVEECMVSPKSEKLLDSYPAAKSIAFLLENMRTSTVTIWKKLKQEEREELEDNAVRIVDNLMELMKYFGFVSGYKVDRVKGRELEWLKRMSFDFPMDRKPDYLGKRILPF